jgi:hypothetical protein
VLFSAMVASVVDFDVIRFPHGHRPRAFIPIKKQGRTTEIANWYELAVSRDGRFAAIASNDDDYGSLPPPLRQCIWVFDLKGPPTELTITGREQYFSCSCLSFGRDCDELGADKQLEMCEVT